MPEGFGGLESFDGLAGKEQAGESVEKFQERYRQAQAAIKQIKKEESRKKQDDDALAVIIVRFLSDTQYSQFFVLMARMVAKNLPSDIILGIISLIYAPAWDYVEKKFASEELFLELPEKGHELQKRGKKVDKWVNILFVISEAEPVRLVQTATLEENKLDPELIQFSSLVLREYLEKKEKRKEELSRIQEFCVLFWGKMLAQLKTMSKYQKLLEAKEENN